MEFIIVAGLVAVVVLALMEGFERWRRRYGRIGEITDAYELAVLVRDGRSLADTVITALVRRNAIRESRDGLCSPVAGMSVEHPAERLVLDALSAGAGRACRREMEQVSSWRPREKQIRAELVRRGLVPSIWVAVVAGIALLTAFPVMWMSIMSVGVAVVEVIHLLSRDWAAAEDVIRTMWPILLAPPLTAAFSLLMQWQEPVYGKQALTRAGEAAYADVLAAHPGPDDSLEAYVLYGEPPL